MCWQRNDSAHGTMSHSCCFWEWRTLILCAQICRLLSVSIISEPIHEARFVINRHFFYLVAMVNHTAISKDVELFDDECPETDYGNRTDDQQDGEFTWSTSKQGWILSSFFYGYVLTQVSDAYAEHWLFENFQCHQLSRSFVIKVIFIHAMSFGFFLSRQSYLFTLLLVYVTNVWFTHREKCLILSSTSFIWSCWRILPADCEMLNFKAFRNKSALQSDENKFFVNLI